MKKILMVVLSIICVTCFSLFFIGCNNENDNDNANNNDQIVEIYNTYVVYAESNGETPLSYEEWLASIKGEKGEKGDTGATGQNGKDGITPTIEIIEGYWYINGENTGVKAEGKDGVNGTNGTNGTTPTIEIIEGYWVINGENTGVKAEGKDGTNGTNGTNGVGIKSVEFDNQGRLVITLTDDTVLPAIEMPKKEEHIHSFCEWIDFTGVESVPCQERLYYHICEDLGCGHIEWRQGCEGDHSLTENYISDYVDNENHYNVCLTCGVYRNGEKHDFNEDAVCAKCGYELPETEGLEFSTFVEEGVTYANVVSIGSVSDVNINIPSLYNGYEVKAIGSNAFSGSKIKFAKIPDSVTTIKDYAFAGCVLLTEVLFSETLTTIGENAFSDCDSLKNVNYLGTIDEWVQIDFCTGKSNPLYYARKFYINNELVTEVNITTATKINSYAFYMYDYQIKSLKIGNSVTSIGAYAFYGVVSINDIILEIPNSVTSIGKFAFGYSPYKVIKIPNSVVNMGDYVFWNAIATIYCEAESQPISWSKNWSVNGIGVYWGYKEEN